MRPAAKYIIVLAAVTGLVSCGPPAHQNETYIFVSTNINIPYWQDVKAGFDDGGKLLAGAKLEFTGPAQYSPEDELKAFQNAVSSHPAGILVSPSRADIFVDAINDAIDAGIPVISVDSDAPRSRRMMFVGTNNYLAGLESGRQMATLLHGRGHVIVVSIPGQDNLEERARGVTDAFKKYPFMGVSQIVNDNGDSQTAADLVSGLLHGSQAIDGVICLEASGGPGVAKALDQSGQSGKIPIVAMDANPDTLTLISQGKIAVTVAQKPYTMGFYGVKFLDDLHHNSVHEFPNWRTAPVSPLPLVVDTGTVVVNGQNIQDYLAAVPARPTK